MRRLTKTALHSNSFYIPSEYAHEIKKCDINQPLINKLGEYEDIGLEPKEIQLIVKAYDLMCDYYGSSIKEVMLDKVGIKKSSGCLWDKFRELAQEAIENDD